MKLTEEQILKIATSHQKQMGSVHPHAIIGTIVDAINEALSQHDVSGQSEQFCECGFVMIMRDVNTDKTLCAECGKEVNEQN